VENALGIAGGQALLIVITAALTILGLVALAAAVFWKKRWRMKYSMEVGFVALLVAMAFIADWNSTKTYTAYQKFIGPELAVSGKTVEEGSVFDREYTVVAFQWGFGFINDENEISRNAAIVKPGEKVLFRILSNDVIHGFNIPVANITAEIDPGEPRNVWIRAPEKPGKYLIQCVNYCGVGHAQMKAWLVVEGPDEGGAATANVTSGENNNVQS